MDVFSFFFGVLVGMLLAILLGKVAIWSVKWRNPYAKGQFPR